jgi:carbon storage regulator
MLVLNRKIGQSITIDDNIKITVLHSKHGGMRLGIKAPEHIKILRDELITHKTNVINLLNKSDE